MKVKFQNKRAKDLREAEDKKVKKTRMKGCRHVPNLFLLCMH